MRSKKAFPVFCFLLLLFSRGMAQVASGYTFSATTGTFSVIQGSSGAVSPALSAGSLDDGWFNNIAIGFPFTFEGTSYTTLSASTNGWFTFASSLSTSGVTNNLNTGTPRPVIAPLWDDLALSATGNFTYLLSGTSPNQVLTLEWLNAKWNYLAGAACISFQVKLYESNKRIEFIYRQEAGTLNSTSASIGIAGASSGNFLSLNGTGAAPAASSATETNSLNSKPATGQIYRFDKPVSCPTITSVTPVKGPIGTTVTISGTNFDAVAANNTVYFGATRATVQSATTTSLTVSTPVGTLYKPVSVTTAANFLTAWSTKLWDVTFSCPGGGSIYTMTSFASGVNFSATTACNQPAIGDFDGDGLADVAVANTGGNCVSVFRNTSTSGTISATSLAAKIDFTTANAPTRIDVGDVDGDGKLDIVVSAGSLISVLRNTATSGTINASSFAAHVDFSGFTTSRGLRIGDMDMDGKPEIVLAGTTGATHAIGIFRNTSSPGSITTSSFAAMVQFATGQTPYDVEIGDLDGDGKPDMASANYGPFTASVFRNTSTAGTINASSFAARVDYPTGYNPIRIGFADFNGDSKLDMVTLDGIGSAMSTSFTTFENTGTPGTIAFGTPYSHYANFRVSDMNLGDYDGDGDIDVLIVNQFNNAFSVFQNDNGTGTMNISWFSGMYQYTASNTSSLSATGDIDGDGKPEVVAADNSTGNLAVFRNITSSFSSIAPATVTGSTNYCYDGVWKVYSDPANPAKVLCAIKENSNSLGTVTVNEYEDGAPGFYNGMPFLARHFKITPATQPSSSVQVRLFFTNAEFTSLQAADPTLSSVAGLSVTKYQGPTEDGTYYPNDATSLLWIPPSSITTGTMYGGNYLEFSVSSFSEFWIHGGTGALPVELLNFSAAAENDHVNLSWSTASEENNDFFTVEKTQDGMHFETVAIVDGAGNSTQVKNYSAVDAHPENGTTYYRLKQTDFNGHFTYSDFAPVTFESEDAQFSIFPNPSSGLASITCPGDKDETATLEIFDNAGRQISSIATTVGGLERAPLELPQGAYSVVVTRGAARFIRKVIVL